ncbi:hypothetical protein TBLA_0A00720 [Henningerozyma blattae CBS 6284]|uniref:Uncharacterized protein n=1 Tax=Henningerozyma blattae (strain ATCC 34711 / CBS 6284 / DSM 70876 / NBRC 10599 / NRRL Y-10934 / UCD 77-7) TaxID=1071380 RepID=I2GUS1_HENB6|nr:hypothetical protein TBLA_0A00720 [Tetrapisispora blattae CBS 6284]CCH57873.1 hypothetical protein TBLA_0A00720 [Tetrapisispora blattae CBS 6284]
MDENFSLRSVCQGSKSLCDLSLFRDIKDELLAEKQQQNTKKFVPERSRDTFSASSQKGTIRPRTRYSFPLPLAAYNPFDEMPFYFSRNRRNRRFDEAQMKLEQYRRNKRAIRNLGKDYFRPIGLNKTMRQIEEERLKIEEERIRTEQEQREMEQQRAFEEQQFRAQQIQHLQEQQRRRQQQQQQQYMAEEVATRTNIPSQQENEDGVVVEPNSDIHHSGISDNSINMMTIQAPISIRPPPIATFETDQNFVESQQNISINQQFRTTDHQHRSYQGTIDNDNNHNTTFIEGGTIHGEDLDEEIDEDEDDDLSYDYDAEYDRVDSTDNNNSHNQSELYKNTTNSLNHTIIHDDGIIENIDTDIMDNVDNSIVGEDFGNFSVRRNGTRMTRGQSIQQYVASSNIDNSEFAVVDEYEHPNLHIDQDSDLINEHEFTEIPVLNISDTLQLTDNEMNSSVTHDINIQNTGSEDTHNDI